MPLSVPAFIYHGFFDGSAVPDGIARAEHRYFLSRDIFCAHLDFLHWKKIRALSVDEWLRSDGVQIPAVLLTFDDGHISNYELVWPMLQERQFRATFFIVTDWIGRAQRVTAGHLRELHAAGISIGSHGTSHTPLHHLTPQALRTDMARSKAVLEDILGTPVRSFAVPGGFEVGKLEQYAHEAGYDHVFTSRPGWAVPGPLLPRLSITRATPLAVFERLAQHDLRQMRKIMPLYQVRQSGKRLFGVESYERIFRMFASRLMVPSGERGT